jgi:hypothetical protein
VFGYILIFRFNNEHLCEGSACCMILTSLLIDLFHIDYFFSMLIIFFHCKSSKHQCGAHQGGLTREFDKFEYHF